jgi:hypothetical protein
VRKIQFSILLRILCSVRRRDELCAGFGIAFEFNALRYVWRAREKESFSVELLLLLPLLLLLLAQIDLLVVK